MMKNNKDMYTEFATEIPKFENLEKLSREELIGTVAYWTGRYERLLEIYKRGG